MKYCILGAGRTGQAMAAYLMQQGIPVGLWDRNAEKCRGLAATGICIEGLCEGTHRPQIYPDIAEAAKADVLLITTTANGHLPLAKRLRGLLQPHQTILIFNGNMGAWEMYSCLKAELRQKQVLIAETGGMLLLCDYNENGVLFFKSLKKEMNLAAIPAAAAQDVIERLRPEYDQFYAVDSVIETSLNNANPVLHAPITLFNVSRIENAEDFGFYSTAASPAVLSFAEKVDAERCAVIRALGAKALSCVEIINSFWPDKYDTLTQAIKNNKAYMSGKGPKSLDYRYVTEDIPFGIAPLAALGKSLHVDTPCIDVMLACYSALMEQDFMAQCPAIDGFADAVSE